MIVATYEERIKELAMENESLRGSLALLQDELVLCARPGVVRGTVAFDKATSVGLVSTEAFEFLEEIGEALLG